MTPERLPHWLTIPIAGLALLLGATTGPSTARGDAVTGDLQRAVRAVTLEVVVPKATEDPLTYEKPLPLELIPYAERNDKYWSIGTAFAIEPGRYVTAAHVLVSVIGSQFGPPALRDSAGTIHPIGDITKFSSHEDFVVFSAAGEVAGKALEVNRTPTVDEAVYAVGNALGEGIIIRDGLFTSETPEQQDGRWKWLRFSAAASPGNSGGPLLDTKGRVVGVVIGKSPNENLNYALPIGRVLDAPAGRASFDQTFLQKLPNATPTVTGRVTRDFRLPLDFPAFSAAYRKLVAEENRRSREQLRSTHAGELFPAGPGSGAVLSTVVNDPFPRFVGQDANGQWEAATPEEFVEIDVPGGIRVEMARQFNIGLFHLSRRNGPGPPVPDDDSRAFMDLLLKAQPLNRQVGTDAVRVTSVGRASRDEPVRDAFGREWRRRIWPLGYSDAFLVTYSLPVPDGSVGMIQTIAAAGFDPSLENLELMADYLYVSYSGTLPQWSRFLDSPLRPPPLKDVSIRRDARKGFVLTGPGLSLKLVPDALLLDDRSMLSLLMTYLTDRGRLTWDVGGVVVTQDPDKETRVSVVRQPRPAELAGDKIATRWKQMSAREEPYNSLARSDTSAGSFWIMGVVDPSAGGPAGGTPSVLYEVQCVVERDVLPWDVEDMLRMTLRDLVVPNR